MKRHIVTISRAPERAAISNFQAKLEATTSIIDRLLLAGRQAPWKATGPSGGGTGSSTGTGTGTGGGTGTGTGGLEL